MNKSFNIWGRDFDLKVIFDVYEDESVLEAQEAALINFEKNADKLLNSSKDIEKYCIKIDGDRIGKKIDNIFKYVMPQSILIKRTDKKRIVVLLCNYRFDEEHGIAMVFENEKLCMIGTQDELL